MTTVAQEEQPLPSGPVVHGLRSTENQPYDTNGVPGTGKKSDRRKQAQLAARRSLDSLSANATVRQYLSKHCAEAACKSEPILDTHEVHQAMSGDTPKTDNPLVAERAECDASAVAAGVNHDAEDGVSLSDQRDRNLSSNRWRLGTVLIILCLATFTVSLDDTIVATAVPRITDDFHSIDDIAWYGSGYLLTIGGTQLLFGKLYALHSDKTIFLMSLCIVGIGSAVSGTAHSSEIFIIGRAIAGMGAAGLLCGGLVILARSVPLRARPISTSLIGSMTTIGSVAGPLLGGLITDNLSWRWCFYINLPIMAALFVGVICLYQPRAQPQGRLLTEHWRKRLTQYDPFGNAAFLPAVVCLQVPLEWGGTRYSWHNPRVIIMFACSALLLAIFIAVQYHMHETATIPRHIMKQRSVASSSAFIALIGGAYCSTVYYMPLWFQGIKGATPAASGIRSVPLLCSMTLSSIGTGVVVSAVGYYTPFVLASPFVASTACGLLSTLQPKSGAAQWIGYQVLLGIGIGCGFSQPFIAVQTVLGDSEVSIGIGLMMCSEMIGGAVGVAIAQKVFESRLATLIHKIAPNVDRSALLKMGATSLTSLVPPDQVGAAREAYNDAVTSTFYLATALAGISLLPGSFMEWKNVKTAKSQHAEEQSNTDGIEAGLTSAGGPGILHTADGKEGGQL